MTTWSVCYQEWLLSIVPMGEGWRIWCLPPEKHQVGTDGEVYHSPEAAMAGAKEYMQRAVAMMMLADVVLDLCEAEKMPPDECYCLLESLGYC